MKNNWIQSAKQRSLRYKVFCNLILANVNILMDDDDEYDYANEKDFDLIVAWHFHAPRTVKEYQINFEDGTCINKPMNAILLPGDILKLNFGTIKVESLQGLKISNPFLVKDLFDEFDLQTA